MVMSWFTFASSFPDGTAESQFPALDQFPDELVFLVAAIGLLTYIYNEEIAARFPQAEPYVSQYMQAANEAKPSDIMSRLRI